MIYLVIYITISLFLSIISATTTYPLNEDHYWKAKGNDFYFSDKKFFGVIGFENTATAVAASIKKIQNEAQYTTIILDYNNLQMKCYKSDLNSDSAICEFQDTEYECEKISSDVISSAITRITDRFASFFDDCLGSTPASGDNIPQAVMPFTVPLVNVNSSPLDYCGMKELYSYTSFYGYYLRKDMLVINTIDENGEMVRSVYLVSNAKNNEAELLLDENQSGYMFVNTRSSCKEVRIGEFVSANKIKTQCPTLYSLYPLKEYAKITLEKEKVDDVEHYRIHLDTSAEILLTKTDESVVNNAIGLTTLPTGSMPDNIGFIAYKDAEGEERYFGPNFFASIATYSDFKAYVLKLKCTKETYLAKSTRHYESGEHYVWRNDNSYMAIRKEKEPLPYVPYSKAQLLTPFSIHETIAEAKKTLKSACTSLANNANPESKEIKKSAASTYTVLLFMEILLIMLLF